MYIVYYFLKVVYLGTVHCTTGTVRTTVRVACTAVACAAPAAAGSQPAAAAGSAAARQSHSGQCGSLLASQFCWVRFVLTPGARLRRARRVNLLAPNILLQEILTKSSMPSTLPHSTSCPLFSSSAQSNTLFVQGADDIFAFKGESKGALSSFRPLGEATARR